LVEYTKAMRNRSSRGEFFKKISATTLILALYQDEIISLEISEKMASIGSNSVFYALPETGHMGILKSETEAVEKIIEFIQS
jgi:pimeloyl-ACP methyl ester carboxylesterase